jgi:hypothetical protein
LSILAHLHVLHMKKTHDTLDVKLSPGPLEWISFFVHSCAFTCLYIEKTHDKLYAKLSPGPLGMICCFMLSAFKFKIV